jgi:CDP-diacylglycerol--serine O-phosphatidyltransferase
MAFHMILPIPMYKLKFRGFRIRENLIRYIIILAGLLMLAFTGLSGVTLVVLFYILLSLLNHLLGMRVSP